MRRFVVLRHAMREGEVHYDLMIEDGPALATFQLDGAPAAEGATGRRSFDHRLLYLDYEGEVSGGRGRVERWDAGHADDVTGTPRAPRYVAELTGARLRGRYALETDGGAVRLARVGRQDAAP